jgi:WD40 repeat protein
MGRLVALKVVRKDLLDDPEVVGRFYREVQVISRLTHPHIVHAYDAGPIGAMHCLVMEYVEGTDLARLVKEKGPVPFAEASTYIHQAALGLQHAHEHGLVHRDIKPPNLIVSGSGRDSCIKVLDLGLARLQRAGTAPGAASALSTGNAASLVTPVGAVLIGTPDYMAPEQALDFHHADARSDIYSLGCTFYFLLTGQPPFPGGTVVQKLWRHQQAPPPDPERADVPAPLLAILHKMLAKRPEDRYQTAAEVANALGPFATRPMPAAGPATGRLPGRRWLVASAALLIALLIWRLAAFRSQELSSLDRLDPKTIMPGDRFEGQPPQLVAILGRPKGMVLIPPNAANPFGEGVRGLAFSPDGKRLATCGYPRTVWLWDLTRSEAQEPTVLSGHTDAVSAVAFDPTGKLLATGGKDLTVRLWNLNRPQPQEQRSLHGPTRDVNTLAFGAGGKLLACGGGDAAIYWWELNESSASPKGPAKTDSWINALALSPDGRSAAAGCSYHNVWLLDLPSNTVRGAPATGHLGQVTAVAFSPDSSTLATGSLDKSVRLWDATGTQLKPRTVLQEHSNAVTSVGYALGGTFLASTGLDGKLVVWDVATQKATRVWQLHGRQIACMAVAADGRHLAAGCTDGKVYIFRLAPPTS